MKETTQIINKILCNYKNLSVDEKNELEELLDLNDQDLFDILFKDTLKFDYLAFPSESDSKESGKLKTCYSIFID